MLYNLGGPLGVTGFTARMEDTMEKQQVLDEKQAADYVGLSVRTLQSRRFNSLTPAFLKLGRSVRYRLTDLDAFLEAHRVDPARGYGGIAS